MRFEQASLEDIPRLTDYAEEWLANRGCGMKASVQISIAIDEIYSNIVRYAYGEGSGPAEMELLPLEDARGVRIVFRDQGKPYDPLQKEDPDIARKLEDREVGGLGIFLVKKTMDDMRYAYEDGRNVLTLIKRY